MIEGGCYCKNIRYQIEDGEYLVANCHCTICRRTSAAPFVTWLVVPKQAFAYIRGRPKNLISSPLGSRDFCADCGTPLLFRSIERTENLDITIGSLDEPEKYIPTVAVHEDSKLCWLGITETPSVNK